MKETRIKTVKELLQNPEHSLECIQVVPSGHNRCMALFEIADFNHTQTQSFIFEIEGFEAENARLVYCEDLWLTSISAFTAGTAVALEMGRTVWSNSSGKWRSKKVANSLMNRIWCDGRDGVYLMGDNGVMLQSRNQGWVEFIDEEECDFADAHGQMNSDIFFVGSRGGMQRFDGKAYHSLHLPFDADLKSVFVSQNGVVRACGDEGVCIEIRNDELIELNAPLSVFFSVIEFKGEVYWGDGDFGIYTGSMTEVLPWKETGMAYDLRADEDFMYCSGTEPIWRFDGADWKSLRPVFDDGWKLIKSPV